MYGWQASLEAAAQAFCIAERLEHTTTLRGFAQSLIIQSDHENSKGGEHGGQTYKTSLQIAGASSHLNPDDGSDPCQDGNQPIRLYRGAADAVYPWLRNLFGRAAAVDICGDPGGFGSPLCRRHVLRLFGRVCPGGDAGFPCKFCTFINQERVSGRLLRQHTRNSLPFFFC